MNRRSVKRDIKEFIGPKEVYYIIVNSISWPYKTLKDLYTLRDKALMSLLYLTGGRINEVLSLTYGQFDFSDSEFVIIKNYVISKRPNKKIRDPETKEVIRVIPASKPLLNFPLPLDGPFGPLTKLFLEYYNKLEGSNPENIVFPISRYRAHAIIKHSTGLWCHWFRSQKISFIVNKVRSALITSQIMGIENPNTLKHYYHTVWREHKEIYK